MSVLTLAETPAGLPRSLPDGAAPPALHAAVVSEVAAHLGPAHAALLARPVAAGDRLLWQAEGAESARLADLPAEGRRALLAAAGAILSDIRRLAESGRSPRLRAAWPRLRLVPGFGAVFAVDGRPVLVDWGRAGTGADATDPLAAYDDRRSFVPPPRAARGAWAASAAAVAVLAVLAVLFLPDWARWAVPAPGACRVEPGQLALMREEAAAGARGAALQAVLAETNDAVGRKQLLCPIPTVQAAAPPPRAPPQPSPQPSPQPPSPPPRAELPADRWDGRDLSMLEGCWRSSTQLQTRNMATNQVMGVAAWSLCFDRGGSGRQTIRWPDGRTCTGPQNAAFQPDGTLLLTDSARCAGPWGTLMRGTFECRRISDAEATCVRKDVEGPATGHAQSGRFTR